MRGLGNGEGYVLVTCAILMGQQCAKTTRIGELNLTLCDESERYALRIKPH